MEVQIELSTTAPKIDTDALDTAFIPPLSIKASSDQPDYTIQWKFGGMTPDWQTQHPTHIIGIVIEKSSQGPLSPTNIFQKQRRRSKDVIFKTAFWAGPSGKLGRSLHPTMLLAPGNWTLRLLTKDLFVGGKPIAKKLSFSYRVYFFSEGIGTWYRDPELDITPESVEN